MDILNVFFDTISNTIGLINTILFVIIQFLANVIQAITGFGGGPIAMPPSMALVGAREAKATITFIMWFSPLIITIQSFKDIQLKKLGIILGSMLPTVVLGMWLFRVLPLPELMLAYGIIVVIIGAKKLFFPAKKPLPKPLQIVALIFAGLMQGMFTSGGPFLALYSTFALPEKRQFRATVSATWAAINTYMVISMYRQGMYGTSAKSLSVLSIIPVLVALWIGNRLNKKMKQEAFMKLVFVLLMISGSLLIVNYFNA